MEASPRDSSWSSAVYEIGHKRDSEAAFANWHRSCIRIYRGSLKGGGMQEQAFYRRVEVFCIALSCIVFCYAFAYSQEQTIAEIPGGFEASDCCIAPESGKAFCKISNGRECYIVGEAWKSEVYQIVAGLTVDSKGDVAVFFCKSSAGSIVMQNDKVLLTNSEDGLVTPRIALSPNGKLVAIGLSDRSGHIKKIWLEGKVVAETEESIYQLSLANDPSSLAYSVLASDGTCYVVFKGAKGESFNSVTAPVVSADGLMCAYMASEVDQGFLVLGPKRSKADPRSYQVFMSRNWERVGFCAVLSQGEGKERGKAVVVDGVESACFEEILGASFSPDGRRYLFAGKSKTGEWSIVVDSLSHKTATLAGPPVFSASGTQVIYCAIEAGKLIKRRIDLK